MSRACLLHEQIQALKITLVNLSFSCNIDGKNVGGNCFFFNVFPSKVVVVVVVATGIFGNVVVLKLTVVVKLLLLLLLFVLFSMNVDK